MVRCHFCHQKIEGMPYTCRRCGQPFCSFHRLPENHNCSGHIKSANYPNKTYPGKKYQPSRSWSGRPIRSKKPRKNYNFKGIVVGAIIIIGIFAAFQYSGQIISWISSNPVEGINPPASQSPPNTNPVSVSSGTVPTVKTPNTPVTQKPNPSQIYKTSPLSHAYPYYSNGQRSISFTTYGGLAEYFSKEDHSYRYDPEKEVFLELLENKYQDEYLAPLLNSIKSASGTSDGQAKVAISLVQHIPYNWDKFYGITMDWYYPYETLHNNKGVCADKSLLMAYLLNKLGYDTVLFEFSDHMAVGVKCDPSYDFYDTGYAFIETTRPTIITFIPDTYLGGFQVTSNPNIIHLNGGNKRLDVSSEYTDAAEYKNLLSMGTVLDQYHYQRWLSLSTKYDLQYDT